MMRNLGKILFALALLAGIAHADSKAGSGSAATPSTATPPAAKPPEMKPPQELADQAKAMAGTWNCTGSADLGGQTYDVKGTITHKTDLDGWWIMSTINATANGKIPMHGMFMTTYDPTAKKWYRTTANARGGHGTAWGTTADKKVMWEGDAHFAMGDVKVRGSEELVSPKEAHVVGEYSKDGGKTWAKDHDITCKK